MTPADAYFDRAPAIIQQRERTKRGDSYDNALAESVIGLFKTEVIHQLRPWKSFEAVEYKPKKGSTGSIT